MQPKNRVIVLGTGGHARVVLEILEAAGDFDIVGLSSGDPNAPASIGGHPFLGGFEVLPHYREQGVEYAAVGIGGWTDNTFRQEVFRNAKALGFELVTAVHPTAIVAANAVIGEGSIVGSGAVIMTDVKIGRNTIISSASLIGHETRIQDHVLISGGAKVGANVEVLTGAVVAFGSTVVSRLKIGENALVAAGAVVVKDVPDRLTVFGIPARPKTASLVQAATG